MSRLRVAHREWRWLWPAAGMLCTSLALGGIGLVGQLSALLGGPSVPVGALLAIGVPAWVVLAGWTVWARLSVGLDARELTIDGGTRSLTHAPARHDLEGARRVTVGRNLWGRHRVDVFDGRGTRLVRIPDLPRPHAVWVARRLTDELGLDGPKGLERAGGQSDASERARFHEGLDHVDVSVVSRPRTLAHFVALPGFFPLILFVSIGGQGTTSSTVLLAQILFTVTLLIGVGIGMLAAASRPRHVDLRIGRDGVGARVRAVGAPEQHVRIPSHQLQPAEIVPASHPRMGSTLLITGTAGQQLEIAGRPLEELQRIAFWLEQARTTARALPEPVPEPPPELQRLRARLEERS